MNDRIVLYRNDQIISITRCSFIAIPTSVSRLTKLRLVVNLH